MLNLSECFAHHSHVTRHAVGSANDVSRWSFSWSFLVSPVLIFHARSRHRLASDCSSFHGISGGCSDRRTARSVFQDRRVSSSVPAISGSLAFGASVRSCLAFADGTVHHERDSSHCRRASQQVRRICNWNHYPRIETRASTIWADVNQAQEPWWLDSN